MKKFIPLLLQFLFVRCNFWKVGHNQTSLISPDSKKGNFNFFLRALPQRRERKNRKRKNTDLERRKKEIKTLRKKEIKTLKREREGNK